MLACGNGTRSLRAMIVPGGTDTWTSIRTGMPPAGALSTCPTRPPATTSTRPFLSVLRNVVAELLPRIRLAISCAWAAFTMIAVQAQEIANLILGSNSATTFLNTDKNGRVDVVAGGRVGHVLNAPAGGIPVPIEVHVSVPPGTIIARSDRVPFPQANISSVLAYRALRDMTQFEYAASRIANTAGGGPRRETELRCNGAFVNRAPLAMSVLQNVG